MSDDSILLELTELLTKSDGTLEDIPIDPEKSIDMVMEELDDVELFSDRQKIVEGDLFRFIDNPQLPTPSQRIAMLDKLEGSLWYDKWESERCAQVSEIEGVDIALARTRIFTPSLESAKQTVSQAFEKIEMIQYRKDDAFQQLEEYADRAEASLDFYEYDEKMDTVPFKEGGETLMDTDMVETVIEMQDHMPYYAIDETTQPISQLQMEMFDGAVQRAESVAWDLIPTAAEIVNMGFGLATQAVGALTVYAIVEGLTPIFKALSDTDWIATPWLTAETKRSIETVENEMTYMRGPEYKLVDNITGFLKNSPFYVWYFDTVDARVKNTAQFSPPGMGWQGFKHTPCSTLWLRGRVVAMFGSSVGFKSPQPRLVFAVKITAENTDMSYNEGTFWVDASRAMILRDNSRTSYAANSINMAKAIFRDLKKNPKNTPTAPTSPKKETFTETLMDFDWSKPPEPANDWMTTTNWGEATETVFGKPATGLIDKNDVNGTEIKVGDNVRVISTQDIGTVQRFEQLHIKIKTASGDLAVYKGHDLEIIKKTASKVKKKQLQTTSAKQILDPPIKHPDRVEFMSSQWPSFNQNNMKMVPPKDTSSREYFGNIGIVDNPFNMFSDSRRRLPQKTITSLFNKKVNKPKEVRFEADTSEIPVAPEPKKRNTTSNNSTLVIAGVIIVAMILFQ